MISERRISKMAQRLLVSRRNVITVTAFSVFGLASGCGLIPEEPQVPDLPDPDAELEGLAGEIVSMANEEPKLRGFVDIEQWVSDVHLEDLSTGDHELLTGAVYLEARRLMLERIEQQSNAQGLNPLTAYSTQRLREFFSNPVSMDEFDRSYYDGVLQDVKSRARTDPTFEADARGAARIAIGFGAKFNCPPWGLCEILAALVVVLFVIAVL